MPRAKFIGEVDTRWLHNERGGDRRMKLLAPFGFLDSSGLLWEAPAGSVIDGSSIPRFFWRLEDPFIGDHRRASVVHDVACKEKTRPWWQVHLAYREASICDGMSTWKANVMWLAIMLGGPKWKAR